MLTRRAPVVNGKQTAFGPAGTETAADTTILVYDGPLRKTMSRLKKLGFYLVVLSCIGGPAIVLFGDPEVPLIKRLIVAGTGLYLYHDGVLVYVGADLPDDIVLLSLQPLDLPSARC